MVDLTDLAQALGYADKRPADWHTLAKVSAVNVDGSLTCYLSGSLTPSSVEAYCDAQVGDVVVVLVSKGKARAIARRGGLAVLYNDQTGTAGMITLAQSAANFEHMRIYYKKSGDSESCGSTDVYQPDGKVASLSLINPYSDSDVQVLGRAVSISGTSLTAYKREAYANTGTGGTFTTTTTPTLLIYRVEAWN